MRKAICKNCKKTFHHKDGLNKNRKYCSRKCRYSKSKVKKKCLKCGSEFLVIKSREKKATYCSLKCKHSDMKRAWEIKKGKNRKCLICGKSFYAQEKLIEKGLAKFCSRKCCAISKRKRVGIEYKGVFYSENKSGYLHGGRKKKLLHREIWKDRFGSLPSRLVLHHKDENRINNRVENLQPMTIGNHLRLHLKGKPKQKKIQSAKDAEGYL